MLKGKVALAALVLGCARGDDREVSASAKPGPPPTAPITSQATSALPPLRDLPEGPEAIPAAQADTLVPAGQLRVELLSAGGMPRQPVRTTVRTGRREELELTADVGVTVAAGGGDPSPQTVPRLHVALEAEVVKADGDKTSLQVKLVEVRTEGGPDVSEVTKSLQGAAFEIPLNERGRAGAPSVPAAASAPALQLWSTVAEALREMVTPFPAEPIGRGAQWHAFERQPRAGVEMLRRTRYTLVKIEGEELSIRGEVREVAVAGGSARDPALPEGLRLNPIEGSASGEHTWRRPLLDAVLPVASDSRLQSKLTTDTHHELGTERVRGVIELRQTLTGKRRKTKEAPHER
jgi:hypothetical protein